MAEADDNAQGQTRIDELLPEDLLGKDERVIFAIKPSLWAIGFWSFRTVVAAVLVAAGTVATARWWPEGNWSGQVIEGCGAVVLGRVGFALLQWASRVYVLTDRRVIRIRGVFRIEIFQCNLEKIQNTFLQLTLPQRLLGLGDIAFTTAGTGQIEAIWKHVKGPLQWHYQLITTINTASA